MSSYQPDRITAETFIDYVEYHPTLDSTNALAVELRDELRVRSPALVLTDEQTSGRGRGSNAWWSTPGALTCSVVVDADQHGPPAESRPLVALAAGLAVRALISELLPDQAVFTKWPNDVLVSDHKICGILSEHQATRAGSVLIIGIGVNVNNSLSTAPDDVRQKATSVFDLTGESRDLTEFIVRLLRHLSQSLNQLCEDPVSIARECGERNRLQGKQVAIEGPAGTIQGECLGIADDGALMLQFGDVVRLIRAGTVVEYS